jgi:hypothetical protein
MRYQIKLNGIPQFPLVSWETVIRVLPELRQLGHRAEPMMATFPDNYRPGLIFGVDDGSSNRSQFQLKDILAGGL